MAEVTLEHIDKVYPHGMTALRDLNLQIADGELIVLVGPSGCGKTTTLRLIAGLEAPSRGTIRIGSRLMNVAAPRQRNVAMVFQKHSLYPHLSVEENLAFGERLRERPTWIRQLFWRLCRPGRYAKLKEHDREIAERVREAANLLELDAVLQRRPHQLSGGEQQRAALGRALVRQPAVYLLDEPLSHLDPRLRAELRRELHLLHRHIRATILYVTHDQLEAMTLGDRIVVLDRGLVQQVDRPAVVYAQPANRFVAGFIGWPAMNFLDGRLVHESDQWSFRTADWDLPLPPEKALRWAPFAGRELTLGIRPEHLLLAGEGWPMEITLVELLGSDCLATFARDGRSITARLDARKGLTSGQTVMVTCDMQQAHLFDRSTGVALGNHGPEG